MVIRLCYVLFTSMAAFSVTTLLQCIIFLLFELCISKIYYIPFECVSFIGDGYTVGNFKGYTDLVIETK